MQRFGVRWQSGSGGCEPTCQVARPAARLQALCSRVCTRKLVAQTTLEGQTKARTACQLFLSTPHVTHPDQHPPSPDPSWEWFVSIPTLPIPALLSSCDRGYQQVQGLTGQPLARLWLIVTQQRYKHLVNQEQSWRDLSHHAWAVDSFIVPFARCILYMMCHPCCTQSCCALSGMDPAPDTAYVVQRT